METNQPVRVMLLGTRMATTSFSLGSDFRLGFHLTLNSSSEESKPFKVSTLSPRVSSPGVLSVTSSPALPTESANNNDVKGRRDEKDREVSVEAVKSLPALPPPAPHQGQTEDPLAQLQNALEKTGFLGRKLLSPPPALPDRALVEKHNLPLTPPGSINELELYRCHLCSFSAASKFQYNAHLNSHFDHKCPFCDYTSRTEGRLKRHVKDFHTETSSSDGWSNNGMLTGAVTTDEEQTGANGEPVRPRRHRCKQCEFVALTKSEFWEHSKTHIKAEKLLTCPKCPFVTEYKHHLEYHLRNHFGSKPFKCNKCNYSCVNKSMLNSHMKSHSNVYQYRCAECSYATKYCHSLKLHLRKYSHKPATVLNSDGSLNPFPVIDVYGTRRGPRPKKEMARLSDSHQIKNMELTPFGGPLFPGPVAVQAGLPFMYPSPHMLGNYNSPMFARSPVSPLAIRPNCEFPFACSFCEFTTDQQEIFAKHLMSHAANENQDLCTLYGIGSETLSHDQQNQHQLDKLPPQLQLPAPPDFQPPSFEQDSNPSPAASPNSRESSPHPLENTITEKEDNLDDPVTERTTDTCPLDLSHPREQPQEEGQQQQTTSSRNRRKGKAYKLNRIIRFQEPAFETEDEFHSEDSCTQREDSDDGQPLNNDIVDDVKFSPIPTDMSQKSPPFPHSPEQMKSDEVASPGHALEVGSDGEEREAYACHYCDMSFKDCVMYTVHMGYHGYRDPFKCNMCGHESKDRVSFFLHIARAAHL